MKQVFMTAVLGKLASSTVLQEPKFNLVAENVEVNDAAHMRMKNSMTEKEAYWTQMIEEGKWKQYESRTNSRISCSGGSVSFGGESFSCSNIDFESFISLSDLSISGNGGTSAGSDIWGWLDPNGREITLMCVDNGVWFIDSSDPENPVRLGSMVSGRDKSSWCDVKVYEDTAYVVKDRGSQSTYGIEVFDLNRLSSFSGDALVSFSPDFVYREHGNSHNVFVNTETGFLYSVGSNTCSGGLHVVDLSKPLEPEFSTCVSSDGYTHDVECIVYDGPDASFTGSEICFASNEDTLTIWDVSSKNSVSQLSRTGYSGSRYTHQSGITDDRRYVLLNDELDEQKGTVKTQTSYIFDVSDLSKPFLADTYTSTQNAADHNLYVWGAIHKRGLAGNPAMKNHPDVNYAYLSNYVAGIRVLDISNLPSATEVGYFDVSPGLVGTMFKGTWSNYMHPSGTLAVSSIDRGLFFLTPKMTFGLGSTPAPTLFPSAGPDCVDYSPSGITVRGLPTECPELVVYCSGYDFVRERCPLSCGECRSVVLATNNAEVINIPMGRESLLMWYIVVGVLATVAFTLALTLIVKVNSTRKKGNQVVLSV
eukprot:snap_masked-scaffold_47-processed-gene-0.31-mRNA-1 protein AED:1.00 eAED:1.00 QI:0/-1/0/0/-1/1/1/0/591